VRPDQRFAFIGDLARQLDGITRGVQRPLLMRLLADSGSAQIRQDLARVTTLARYAARTSTDDSHLALPSKPRQQDSHPSGEHRVRP
jgi:hypothetical protein